MKIEITGKKLNELRFIWFDFPHGHIEAENNKAFWVAEEEKVLEKIGNKLNKVGDVIMEGMIGR